MPTHTVQMTITELNDETYFFIALVFSKSKQMIKIKKKLLKRKFVFLFCRTKKCKKSMEEIRSHGNLIQLILSKAGRLDL